MNYDELVNHLRYLINKYVPVENRDGFEKSLLMDDIPVKGILADSNELSINPIEDADGDLIRNIYFHFC